MVDLKREDVCEEIDKKKISIKNISKVDLKITCELHPD